MRGAEASANLYTVIETAKANGIEPYAYLRHVFAELPKATTLEDVEALLPDRVDREQMALVHGSKMTSGSCHCPVPRSG